MATTNTAAIGFGGGGPVLGPATNTFDASTQALALAALTAYGVANPSWLAQYDANSGFYALATYLVNGSKTGTGYIRSGGAWVSIGVVVTGAQGPQGETGSAANLADVPNNHIPIKGASGEMFYDSGITRLDNGTGEYEAVQGMIVPRSSLQIGYASKLSGFGALTKFISYVTGLTGFYPFQYYSTGAGSGRIQEFSFGAASDVVVQSSSSNTVSLAGSFNITTTSQEVIYYFRLKTDPNATISNVRFASQVVGMADPFFYYPTKSAWTSGTGGTTLTADSNGIITLDLTDSPIAITNGITVTTSYAVGNGPIYGSNTGSPYLVANLATGQFLDVARVNDIPDLSTFDWIAPAANTDVTITSGNLSTYRNKAILLTKSTAGNNTLNLGGTAAGWQDGDEVAVKVTMGNGGSYGQYYLINAGSGAQIDGETDWILNLDDARIIKYKASAATWYQIADFEASSVQSMTNGTSSLSINYVDKDKSTSTVQLAAAHDASLTGSGSTASPLSVRMANLAIPTTSLVSPTNDWTVLTYFNGTLGFGFPTIGGHAVGISNLLDKDTLEYDAGTGNFFNNTQRGSVIAKRLSGTQSVNASTDATVVFDTNDTRFYWNDSLAGLSYNASTGVFTNTSQKTISVCVSYQINWATNSQGWRYAWIRCNNDNTQRLAYTTVNAINTDVTVNSGSATFALAANGTFDIRCWQTSNGALSIGTANGGLTTGFGTLIQITTIK